MVYTYLFQRNDFFDHSVDSRAAVAVAASGTEGPRVPCGALQCSVW